MKIQPIIPIEHTRRRTQRGAGVTKRKKMTLPTRKDVQGENEQVFNKVDILV